VSRNKVCLAARQLPCCRFFAGFATMSAPTFPELKPARAQATEMLRLARKVVDYRRDIAPPRQLDAVTEAAARLRELLENSAANAEELNHACELLHEALARCGGDLYPVTFWGENIEMLLVAAILAIGIRSFFLMPFKIPTNSMYPSYNGLTPAVYAPGQPGPGALERVWRFVTLGATHHELLAPADGEVVVPLTLVRDADGRQQFLEYYKPAPSTALLDRLHQLLGAQPDPVWEYTLLVGGQPADVQVPKDFRLDEAFLRSYFPNLAQGAASDTASIYDRLAQHGYIYQTPEGNYYLRTRQTARRGEPVLNFDVCTGDMLFVDRFTYNFFPPRVGDPFVFRTGGIEELTGNGQDEQYYIKRLVGRPGDVMEVRPPVLWRNHQPILGAAAFAKNAHQTDNYPGYVNGGALGPGESLTVAPGFYFAMGDNSPLSYDSRYWGGVPQGNVVGRAVLIVYPFSARWGLAH
jgi:signal peptidase I